MSDGIDHLTRLARTAYAGGRARPRRYEYFRAAPHGEPPGCCAVGAAARAGQKPLGVTHEAWARETFGLSEAEFDGFVSGFDGTRFDPAHHDGPAYARGAALARELFGE